MGGGNLGKRAEEGWARQREMKVATARVCLSATPS